MSSEFPVSVDPSEAALAAFAAASLGAAIDRVHLVSLYPYQSSGETGEGVMPVMSVPVMSLPDGEEGVEDTTEDHFSDRGWISGPGDAPAHRYFDGRAANPLSVERAVPVAPDAERRLAVQFGAIELINADGALDLYAAAYPIDGRRVHIRVGRRGDPLADFATLHDGVGLGYSVDRDRVSIDIADNSFLADVPLQSVFYAGTGGKEGGDDLKGKPKPVTLGRPGMNITPVPVDSANLVWQFHRRLAQAVDAAYDSGAALTFDGDYASYDLLVAASIAAGRYATCLAEGMVRCQTKPAGELTLDVRGDAEGGYVSACADVMKRAWTDFGGLAVGYLDLGRFASIAAAAPYEIGYYAGVDGAPLVADFFDEAARSIGGWWGCLRYGLIGLARLEEPSPHPSLTLDTANIVSLDQVQLPQGLSPPPYRLAVGWRRNWTVQTPDALAAGVAASRVATLGQEYRAVSATAAGVQARHPQARAGAPVPTLLYAEAAAAAEAARLIALHGVERLMVEATVKAVGYLLDLGDTVLVVWPRYGLHNGRRMVVVGIAEDCGRGEVVLTLWG